MKTNKLLATSNATRQSTVMKAKSLLLVAATMMSASSAMAQERVLAGLDSTVVYARNEAGQMEVQSTALYQRNEAGQVVSKTYSQFGNPHEYIVFTYEDYNGDGTIDEVQEYSYWNGEQWDKNVKKVDLNFNTNMKYDLIDLSWDRENNIWVPSAETVINLSDEGRTAEVVNYWQDYETKALVPFQKQHIEMRTSVFDKMAADPETSLAMLLHRHVQDYTLSERFEYNSETKNWDISEHRTRTYNENGEVTTEEERYYNTYPTVTLFAGNRTVMTKTDDGYREDIYAYNNGNEEWQLDGYLVVATAGNRMTRSQYRVENGAGLLHWQEVHTLDAKGRAIEVTSFQIMEGKVGDPSTRNTFEYDEEANKMTEKRYNYIDGAWSYSAINVDEYDKAGRLVYNAYAQADGGADKGWSYGNKYTTQYTADGKVITNISYNLDLEASTIDELVWEVREKYCNYFHHSNAEAATTDGVTVTPSDGTAQFTWPIVPDAYTYHLYVYLHGSLFHHYVFDGQGRLLGINYAPGRDGAAHAPRYASETANGWQFTIQDLDLGEEYTYTFTAEDEKGTELQKITDAFKTTDPTGIHSLTAAPSAARTYSLNGVEVGEGYKGIVIRDGKKFIKK